MENRKAIPFLMGLNWLPEQAAFVLTINGLFIEKFCKPTNDFINPYREILKTKYPKFVFNPENPENGFGINGCFTLKEVSPTGISFNYAIPSLKEHSEEICLECTEGVSNLNQQSCYSCRGTTKKLIDDETGDESFHEFCTTILELSNFVHMVALFEYSRISKDFPLVASIQEEQTMVFELSEKTGFIKGWMSGWLHDAVIEKVKQFSDTEIMAVQTAMLTVESKLFLRNGENDIFSYKLVRSDTGSFFLQVPGSACTLGIEEQVGNSWSWGKKLSPHNVDHRTSQISLLAGLAMLNQIALSKM